MFSPAEVMVVVGVAITFVSLSAVIVGYVIYRLVRRAARDGARDAQIGRDDSR